MNGLALTKHVPNEGLGVKGHLDCKTPNDSAKKKKKKRILKGLFFIEKEMKQKWHMLTMGKSK